MNPADTSQSSLQQRPIKDYAIQEAIIALGLGAGDEVVLDYLDFLTAEIPVGRLYFVHVLPKFDLFNALYERDRETLVSNYELNQEVISRMEAKIRQRKAAQAAVQVSFDVREGNPLEELVRDAIDINSDLVVIGQRNGIEQHGILARNLIRKVNSNALVVPEKARHRLRSILVPIDFSAHSVEALRTALAIRRRWSEPVRIVCVNVYDMPNTSLYRIHQSPEDLKKVVEEDRAAAFRTFLNNYADGEEDQIETALLERSQPGTASYIIDYARKEDIDLVIIGAKGHSKVELLLLGSVTEKLLSTNDQIPTLVVKEQR